MHHGCSAYDTRHAGRIVRWFMLITACFIIGTSSADALCIAGGTKSAVPARRPAKTVALRSGVLDKIGDHTLYLTNGERYSLRRVPVKDYSRYKNRNRDKTVIVEMSFVNGVLVEVILR